MQRRAQRPWGKRGRGTTGVLKTSAPKVTRDEKEAKKLAKKKEKSEMAAMVGRSSECNTQRVGETIEIAVNINKAPRGIHGGRQEEMVRLCFPGNHGPEYIEVGKKNKRLPAICGKFRGGKCKNYMSGLRPTIARADELVVEKVSDGTTSERQSTAIGEKNPTKIDKLNPKED